MSPLQRIGDQVGDSRRVKVWETMAADVVGPSE
jgi:hypothetical protein